jgi:uncharacterized protein
LSYGQDNPNTILWEVSKPGVKYKSYLFGTFHQVAPTFFDSLCNTNNKFNTSTALFVESISDKGSSLDTQEIKEMFSWKVLKWDNVLDSSQKQIFSKFVSKSQDSLYYSASPVTLYFSMLDLYFMFFCETKRQSTLTMDAYIAQVARWRNMKITGLDKNRFNDIKEASQKDSLLSDQKTIKNSVVLMQLMLDDDLSGCESLHNYKSFALDYAFKKSVSGLTTLLENRNESWMEVLPKAFENESCFVAVGIRHLFYKNGLIERLRHLGYRVIPIAPN